MNSLSEMRSAVRGVVGPVVGVTAICIGLAAVTYSRRYGIR